MLALSQGTYTHPIMGMILQQLLEKLCHFLSTLSGANQDEGFSSVVIDCPSAIPPSGLSWSGDHDLLSKWTPHCPQGGKPTEVELVGVIEHFSSLQSITAFLDRFFSLHIPDQDW